MRMVKLSCLGLFFILTVLPPILGAREEYKLISSWGKKGSGRGELTSPCGIAVDKKGTVYIADSDRQCILVFTSQGKFLKEWKTRYPPLAIAVDVEGNVYVGGNTHKELGLIEKFTGDGKLLNQFTYKGRMIGGIALSEKHIYIGLISLWWGSIQRFTKEGVLLKSWGKLDSCCGYLDVAVDSEENVYVAELGAHRVVKYNREGEIIKRWGKVGKKEGEFCGCCNPTNIAVGPDNSVFTAEKDTPRIQKFTKDGVFITSFGKGKFSEECGYLDIAVSADGKVFVVDDGAGRVLVFAKR